MGIREAIRRVLGRRGLERDVAEETEAHILHRVDDLVADGHAPEDARAQAEREFGDLEGIREACVSVRLRASGRHPVPRTLDGWRQDLSYAARQVRRSPGFAAVVVLTLALGIGATTTITAVVKAVVMAPLPFTRPDRLVYVQETTPKGSWFSVSEPSYLDWRARASTLSEVGALTFRSGTVEAGAEPRAVTVAWTSASLTKVLGVRPILGRTLREDEDQPRAPKPVTVLTYGGWQDLFGGDPTVLGRKVVLDGSARTVVGVLPDHLSFLDGADMLVPLGANPAADRDEHYLDVWARLAPGTGIAAARAQLSALAKEIDRLHPEVAGWGARILSARDVLVGHDLQRAGWVLLAAAALLLLIACVNVSNLLLARGTVRRAEVGVRMALGAGRGRILRQLFVESAVLAFLGGVGGLALTRVALPVVRHLGAGRIPRLGEAAIDPTVLLASLAAVILAALLFGLAPGLDLGWGRRRGAAGPMAALRSSRGLDAPSGRRLRSAMVAGQIALSMALLLGTGLLLRSFLRLTAVDPGFDPHSVVTAQLSMPDAVYDPGQRRTLVREILDAVGRVPGVVAVGATAVAPFQGMNLANFTAREDRMPADARDFLPIKWRVVTPGYFRAAGIELLEGRPFRSGDGGKESGTPVIVSRTLAHELWPNGDALGGTLVWGDPQGSRMTIVGIAADVQDVNPGETPPPIIYRTHQQIPWAVMTLVARLRRPSASVNDAIHATIRRVAPGLAVPALRPLTDDMRTAVAPRRFNALLLGTFAAAGLLLALVGVYGVTAFGVSQRMREIAIRLALGGRPSEILRMVLSGSLRLAAAGTVLGGTLAWGAGRWVKSLLYHTAPTDTLTWLLVPGLLLAASMVAAYLGARRATRVDPRGTLGGE